MLYSLTKLRSVLKCKLKTADEMFIIVRISEAQKLILTLSIPSS